MDQGKISPPDFEDLRKRVVQACNGLPLSLKVMGSFLRNQKRLRSWECALQRMTLGKGLDGDAEIWNTLQVSYDGLNDVVEKSMFLDVACFFCRDVYPLGISKEAILCMWSKDGNLPVAELGRLIDMSLLKVNEDDAILEMHDQLRDMGQMIAGGSRVWKASMIPDDGFPSPNIEVLEGISWQATMSEQDLTNLKRICEQRSIVEPNSSFKFQKLCILILVSTLDDIEGFVDNFCILVGLASQCSRLEAIMIQTNKRSIPFSLPHPAHIADAMHKGIIDLCAMHISLKVLYLTGLGFLDELPIKCASSHAILRVNLTNCSRLVALSKEVGNLSSLTTLDLKGCSSFLTLPMEVGNLSSLTRLNLKGCSSLSALPKEVGNLSSLTTLNLLGFSSSLALPKEVGNFSSLTTLDLEDCSSLSALPMEVGNLSSLTTLDLRGCSSLSSLPKEVGNLSSLTTLDLKGCSSLSVLPEEVGNLSSLTTLNLSGCLSSLALPKEVGHFSSLTTLDLEDCSSLSALPKEVGNLSSLTRLNLSGCSSLLALPEEVGNLSSLTTLNLKGFKFVGIA